MFHAITIKLNLYIILLILVGKNFCQTYESNGNSTNVKTLIFTWTLESDLLIYKEFLQSVDAYSQQHGYHRVISTEQYDFRKDEEGFCSKLPKYSCQEKDVHWYSKPKLLLNYCFQYDWILYVDSDVRIIQHQLPLSYFIESARNTTEIFVAWTPPRVNAGVFLLKGGRSCHEFIHLWIQQNRWYAGDNGRFNHALVVYDGNENKSCEHLDRSNVRANGLPRNLNQIDNCFNKGYGIKTKCDCKTWNMNAKIRFICSGNQSEVALQGEDSQTAFHRGGHCRQAYMQVNRTFAYHGKCTNFSLCGLLKYI